MNVGTYSVTIEELVSQDFSVEAVNKEEAIRKAIDMYKHGTIVLSPGSLEMKRIQVSEESDKWIEF